MNKDNFRIKLHLIFFQPKTIFSTKNQQAARTDSKKSLLTSFDNFCNGLVIFFVGNTKTINEHKCYKANNWEWNSNNSNNNRTGQFYRIHIIHTQALCWPKNEKCMCIRSFIFRPKGFFHNRIETAIDLDGPIVEIFFEINHVRYALFRFRPYLFAYGPCMYPGYPRIPVRSWFMSHEPFPAMTDLEHRADFCRMVVLWPFFV